MARKTKQIYTAKSKDIEIIKEWLDSCSPEYSELKLQILDFFLKWIMNYNRKKDPIYHNSIYRILKSIGMNPKADKESANNSPI